MQIKTGKSEMFDEYFTFLSPLVGQNNSKRLLLNYSSLTLMARSSNKELRSHAPNIKPAQIERLRSAFNVGKAIAQEKTPNYKTIMNSKGIADAVRWHFRFSRVEQFYVLSIDISRNLISVDCVAEGNVKNVSVAPREVFAPAISHQADYVALCHNHPSGDPTPSDADIKVTKHLAQTGRHLGIFVLDHVVLGLPSERRKRDYCSLKDMDLVNFREYQEIGASLPR